MSSPTRMRRARRRARFSSSAGCALAALACLLAAPACGKKLTPEQALADAETAHAATLRAPQSASPDELAAAVQAFNQITAMAPGSLTAGRAEERIGLLYLERRDTSRARSAFRSVFMNYFSHRDLAMMGLVHLARSEELDGDWDSAVKTYRLIADYHEWSDIWIEAPLYVPQMYERQGDREAARIAYGSAASTLQSRIRTAPNPASELKVKACLVLAYQGAGESDRAAMLRGHLLTESLGPLAPDALFALGRAFERILSVPAQARAVYQRLAEEFPDHPAARYAREGLARLGSPSAGQESAARRQ